MNKIVFPLRRLMQGGTVADLQDALQLLLDEGVLQLSAADDQSVVQRLRAERLESQYGEATQKLVELFQTQQQLDATGEVDERTANALNQVLDELGAFRQAASDQQPMVGGRVQHEDGRPFRGGLVRAFHVDPRGVLRLGEDTTDADGRYTIRYALLPDVDAIDLRVVVYSADGEALREAEVVTDAKQLEIVDLLVPNSDRVTYSVEGRVISRISAAVNGLRVQIVDKGVGGNVQLSEALTNEEGIYQTSFTDVDLRQRGKERPDIQARVYAGDTFLAASDARYDAESREVLNVLLGDKTAGDLKSEHATLTAAIANHFNGGLGGLEETDDRQDITYLANKTGWDGRAVALAALADRFSSAAAEADATGEIEPAFFYALFRAGLPANEDALYQVDVATAEAIWKQAIDQGVIPDNLNTDLAQTVERFQSLAAKRTLDGQALVGLSSYKDMLSVSLGDDEQKKEQFANLLTRYRSDPPKLWEAVRDTLGAAEEKRLKLDGQLFNMSLNNARLIRKLHQTPGEQGLNDMLDLAAQGFHRADRWQAVIGDDPIPPEISSENGQETRARYAELLAAQVRLSFPTAVVAAMVKTGETPIAEGFADSVHAFLAEQQGKFEIGMQPVKQYVRQNNLQIAPETLQEITRIQRVFQITPGNEAMNVLLHRGVDSAYAVTRYHRDEFIRVFKNDVGGEADARLIHAKAQQVHNTVLNIALSYLTAANAPGIGVHSPAKFLDPAPKGVSDSNAADVIAYPTLEGLFGEMDYCTCEHCRSILSPAAYLVDLLMSLDRDDDVWANTLEGWKADHGNAPYPFAGQDEWNAAGQPTDTEITPLGVLLSRRPDLQHLPLSCENTNTPLPYIDLVNETLEHYVLNGLSLENYSGHTTEADVTPEELLASPQFVSDQTYITLGGAHFPPPMPFHQPLEYLRRYFDRFEVSLPEVLELLRKDDSLERASPSGYGWRDILMEELRLSRTEHALLSNRNLTLKELYGYKPETPESMALADLSKVKAFTRRVGISYEEIIEILKTRFINPNSTLIPKLERLGVAFQTIKGLKDGTITDAEFEEKVAPHIDETKYGGDITGWVKNEANYAKIMGLITLSAPDGMEDVCNFDTLEFRYANPDNNTNKLRPFEFVRLSRFIRLWKKLGWTIEQTDKAITALYPVNDIPNDPDDAVNLQRLDDGFLTLLPRLGVIKRVMSALKLKPKKDLLPLLVCFAPIDVHGTVSLYRQLLLNATLLKLDPAFADDGYGEFLTNPDQKLMDHVETLRGAFGMTADEVTEIISVLGYDGNTALGFTPTVAELTQHLGHAPSNQEQQALTAYYRTENISAVFRRGWLARKLRLSVREFISLTAVTGFDPFAAPDPVDPPIQRLIELLDRIRSTSLKPEQGLYLIWNQDISGRSDPDDGEIYSFARTLRSQLAAIESNFNLVDDPEGTLARERMALVYGNEATDHFFGLMQKTVVTDVKYEQAEASLSQAVMDTAAGDVAYDSLRKRLIYTAGVMSESMRDALKAIAGATTPFKNAVDALFLNSRAFFDHYPELLPHHDDFVSSLDTKENKHSHLLKQLLPNLKYRRKRQQILQSISAATNVDIEFAVALLDAKLIPGMDDKYIFHGAGESTRPALDDLMALEKAGLFAEFFFRDTATGNVDVTRNAEPVLAYSSIGENQLPQNANAPENAISGVWSGYLAAPESGFFNIGIAADAGATVTLSLNGKAVTLAPEGIVWRNVASIELNAGELYPIVLRVEKVKATLSVRWETPERRWEVIPPQYLYGTALPANLRLVYVRFLKAATLATTLKLTATELAHFASHEDYRYVDQGWLNSLPVIGSPDMAASKALLKACMALMNFSRIKADLSPNDEALITVFKDPSAATNDTESLLFILAHWESTSLGSLLSRFGKAITDLAHFETFNRVYEAYVPLNTLRISASALVNSATNDPSGDIVRDLQAALRARYDESDWLSVLRPVNDEMRGLQRDALVAYILHQMRQEDDKKHIDTPDKLFEYFLMDVQMEPCMQTSRVRHALSSVQLFIERSLMNLEQRVSPAMINAKQWEWKKRYRVWEANRKVFIWPENWLEPELRDDQSPFFKEAMSELLQGDITEERAQVALLNYLSKLEEVAKLELCGIHYEEADPQTGNNTAHVVARTAGANRKYYYRRRELSGWTPWEEIKLNIEDNPVIPVVWENRLFLFWVRIIKKASLQTPSLPQDKLAKIEAAEIIDPDSSKMKVKAILSWSEYYNGKWQSTKTSDVDQPTELDLFLPGEKQKVIGGGQGSGLTNLPRLVRGEVFDRSSLLLSAPDARDALLVTLSNQGESHFTLYNTHSLPVRREDGGEAQVYFFESTRSLNTLRGTFNINYATGASALRQATGSLTRPVLINKLDGRTVEPQHTLKKSSSAPFFYQDSRHVFYVTTAQPPAQVGEAKGYGVSVIPPKQQRAIAPLVLEPIDIVPDKVGPIVTSLHTGVADPAPMERFVSEDAYIRAGLGTVGTVRFGGKDIGPAGGLTTKLQNH